MIDVIIIILLAIIIDRLFIDRPRYRLCIDFRFRKERYSTRFFYVGLRAYFPTGGIDVNGSKTLIDINW